MPAEGEGGEVAAGGLCTLEPCGRTPVAIIGGTGYVGRLLARRLLSHPTMCLGPIIGSSRSEGMVYKDVWVEKEANLMKNYGSQLWTAMPFPPELEGVTVGSFDELCKSETCKVAISCVAPDVGYVEDILVNNGFKVFSISPYKRSENLTVPEVNPAQIAANLEASLFKSPNCGPLHPNRRDPRRRLAASPPPQRRPARLRNAAPRRSVGRDVACAEGHRGCLRHRQV